MDPAHADANIAREVLLPPPHGTFPTPNDAGHRRALRSLHHTGHPLTAQACNGPGCAIFYVSAIAVMLTVLLGILGYTLHKRLRFRRAVAAGVVPAKMAVSHWNTTAAELGDIEAFVFPVSRPATRDAVNEEACPICLATRPRASSWVTFGVCNHSTCVSCFKKLAARQRLHAACPLCRTLLATGKGDRGRKKEPYGRRQEQEQQQQAEGGQAAAQQPNSAPPPAPLPGRDDNV